MSADSQSLSAADSQALQATIAEALADLSAPERVRELMATRDGWERRDWQRLCGELGAAGIAVDEQNGGSGLSAREAGMLFEAAGRYLLCAPLLSVTGLAIPLLQALDDAAACASLLPGLVSGEVVATVGIADGAGRHGVDHLGVRCGSDGRLTGRLGYVIDGATADVILVPAVTDDGCGIFVVDPHVAGVTVTPLVTLDQTRKQAHVDLDGAAGDRIGSGDATAALTSAYDVARAMLACEQVGVISRCLEMTVEFAKLRVQFGRPIGSFQAIKQRLADLLIKAESARSAAMTAAAAAADGSPDLGWTAAVAKAYASEAASLMTAETIQLHGGIGFTWEHDAHLYFKRARASEEMLGTPRELYDQVAAHVAAL